MNRLFQLHLQLIDHSGINRAGLHDLADFAFFIAHMRQLILARPKTDRRDPQSHQGHGVGAEIPEIILFRRMAEGFTISRDECLGKFVLQADFPGQVEGLGRLIAPRSRWSAAASQFPRSHFYPRSICSISSRMVSSRFAHHHPAVQVNLRRPTGPHSAIHSCWKSATMTSVLLLPPFCISSRLVCSTRWMISAIS